LLRQLAHDHRAGGVGQPFELLQMLAEVRARLAALERRSDEERPLDWLLDLDLILGDRGLRPANAPSCCSALSS
jgi:hypothetical protein